MVSKGFPDVTTSGRQYNIGEKPSVILHTVHLHYICLGVPEYSSSNMVLYGLREVKKNFANISIKVRFIFVDINLWEATQGKFIQGRRGNCTSTLIINCGCDRSFYLLLQAKQ